MSADLSTESSAPGPIRWSPAVAPLEPGRSPLPALDGDGAPPELPASVGRQLLDAALEARVMPRGGWPITRASLAAFLSAGTGLPDDLARMLAILFLADGQEIGARDLGTQMNPHRRLNASQIAEMAGQIEQFFGSIRTASGFALSPEGLAATRSVMRDVGAELMRCVDDWASAIELRGPE